ncbi:MAG: D-alanyl-D-alanine carboxypeptidase DacF [Alphaproteobacteria bacterium MarineAlpha4_Bin2]|nr:MAG: D-alanyl-D-alanine carboxypeptidase DacF [Alphaproteobacteria bacterium MarineAlpha4_Bin2]
MAPFNIKFILFFIGAVSFFSLIETKMSAARYASIVVDASTGKVLHASNPDRKRYPASLTKMMTLYMVFDALERGKLSINQKLKVSRRAQGMAPSKLGLKRGQTLRVKDAVLALITKSANDAAVVVAEALGGTEIKFARMMTKKSRQLGMRQTRFRNASGLPNRRQLSTARDMATLARRLINDFPQYYHFFGTQRFSYKRRTFRNHNKMLVSYPGVDGIKTGYIRASGFNLVASTKRHGRRLIGVVFGGKSAKSRDRHMRRLFERAFALVPKKRISYAKRTVAATGQKQTRVAKTRRVANARSPYRGPDRIRRWAIQVGAFSQSSAARLAAYGAAGRLQGVANHGRVAIVTNKQDKGRLYRAQIVDMSQGEAVKSCSYLRAQRHDCVAIPPIPQ